MMPHGSSILLYLPVSVLSRCCAMVALSTMVLEVGNLTGSRINVSSSGSMKSRGASSITASFFLKTVKKDLFYVRTYAYEYVKCMY